MLKCHPAISLFLQPLDPAHPRYHELKDNFINLNKIELNMLNNKYSSTFHLGLDFRKMWKNSMKLYIDDPEKINKIQQIQTYFD